MKIYFLFTSKDNDLGLRCAAARGPAGLLIHNHPGSSNQPGAWGLEDKEQEEMEGSLWEIFWARHASGLITSTCVPSVEMWSGGLI